MTKSNRAQKLFLRLSSNQRKRWAVARGMSRSFRRGPNWGKKFPVPNRVKVEIINAVTGERTVAYAFEESRRALKKWLRLRNVRAQFDSMLLHPKSSWFNFTTEEWHNFPIIVKVDRDYEVPYVINYVGEKVTIKNKTTCSLYLHTVDNINYLSTVSAKKKLMKDWIAQHPVKVKRKTKKKKKTQEFDFDD